MILFCASRSGRLGWVVNSVILGCSFLLIGARVWAAPMYTILDLGTLGGSSSYTLGYGSVNNLGQVVGESGASNSQTRAFRSASNAPLTPADDLGVLGTGQISKAYSINDAGQAVGQVYVSPFPGENHAFHTDPNGKITTATDLGTLGGHNSIAFGINASGQVVGESEYTRAGNPFHAFRTTATGKITAASDLGTLTGTLSNAYDINDSGQVVGRAFLAGDMIYHAYRTTATGGITPNGDLGTLGGLYSVAYGINNSGQVVGGSALKIVGNHAFRTTATGKIDAASDLGTLGGDNGYAYAINNLGQAVGYSTIADDRTQHAFFDDVTGPMLDLNNLVPKGSGWVLSQATGINDLGQISGFGDIAGHTHAFLLTPVGGPATGVPLPGGLVAGGLLGAGMVVRRTWRK